jgi:hypothetical protein
MSKLFIRPTLPPLFGQKRLENIPLWVKLWMKRVPRGGYRAFWVPELRLVWVEIVGFIWIVVFGMTFQPVKVLLIFRMPRIRKYVEELIIARRSTAVLGLTLACDSSINTPFPYLLVLLFRKVLLRTLDIDRG